MNAGEQGKISKRTKAWMDKKGQTGAPGGDAMKARESEHKARRGVKKAKKERDYDAWEREKMKKDDPNWKHKKGSTSEEVESLKRLIESGKFSDKEIETMAWDIYEGISASGYARAKKYREDQAREKNRRENPQQAEFFREVDKIKAAKAKRKAKAEKNLASNMKKENYQAMRNPEKEEKKDTRSAREKRMADPKKGINSPAFKEFMRQQGM